MYKRQPLDARLDRASSGIHNHLKLRNSCQVADQSLLPYKACWIPAFAGMTIHARRDNLLGVTCLAWLDRAHRNDSAAWNRHARLDRASWTSQPLLDTGWFQKISWLPWHSFLLETVTTIALDLKGFWPLNLNESGQRVLRVAKIYMLSTDKNLCICNWLKILFFLLWH